MTWRGCESIATLCLRLTTLCLNACSHRENPVTRFMKLHEKNDPAAQRKVPESAAFRERAARGRAANLAGLSGAK